MAQIYGTFGDDLLIGTSGGDYIFGSYGDDTLEGGDGDDVLYGSLGDDLIIGGDGSDTAIYWGDSSSFEITFDAIANQWIVRDLRSYGEGVDRVDVSVEFLSFLDTTIELVPPVSNEAPTVAQPIEDQTGEEDAAFSFDMPAGTFSDADGDALALTATLANGDPLPDWLDFDGVRFTGTPEQEDASTITVRVTADDGNGGTVSDDFELEIAPVNDAPELNTPVADQEASAGSEFSFDVPGDIFSDEEGDTLTLTAELENGDPLPDWLSFDGGRFSGTPQAGDAGTLAIRVTADDGNGGSTSDVFELTVGVNTAPELITPITEQAADEDAAYVFDVPAGTFADADGDTLTLSATLSNGESLPDWLSFDGASFTGTPEQGDVGTVSVRVTADDGHGGTATADFDLVVSNVNDAPIAMDDEYLELGVNESGAIAYNNGTGLLGNDSDEDGDTLVITAINGEPVTLGPSMRLPSGATLKVLDGGAFVYSQASRDTDFEALQVGETGKETFTYTVSDGHGGEATATVTIWVYGVNDPPTVSAPIGAQTAAEDSAFSFILPEGTFADVEGDTLTLSATLSAGEPLPDWLSFDGERFFGTPGNEDTGTFHIQVTANDGHGGEAWEVFTLNIDAVNDAPEVDAPLADQTAQPGEAFAFQVPADTFSDEEGDALALSATLADGSALPDWLSFNAADGSFAGTPEATDAGTIEVRVTADDGNGGTVWDVFQLTIGSVEPMTLYGASGDDDLSGGAGNDLLFGGFGDDDLSGNGGDDRLIGSYGDDHISGGAGEDHAEYWGFSSDFDISFDTEAGQWVVTDTRAGGEGVDRLETDVEYIDFLDTSIRLDPPVTNNAPTVANAITDQAASEDAAFSFEVPSGTFVDADGDTLTLTATLANGDPLPDWLDFDGSGFSGTPEQADVGEITVRVTADDGNGGTVSTDFDLSVQDTFTAVVLNGVDAGDYSGRSVSDAGDVDGDGKADVLIGAPWAKVDGNRDAGEAYLVWGAALAADADGVVDLASLGTDGNGVRFDAIDTYDYVGWSVSSAGDVDGDGQADILIGAQLADSSGNGSAGEVYLIWGAALASDTDGVIDLANLQVDGAGVRLEGADTGDYVGWSVSSAGDVDGDGQADILIGGYGADPNGDNLAGETYLIWGSALTADTDGVIDLANLSADGAGVRLDGIDADDSSGNVVSNAGDVDGDGRDDILIGAFGADPNGNPDAGETYLVWGAALADDEDGVIDLASLQADGAGVRLDGADAGDNSGYSVSSAGDVDGDGNADILIGARSADPNGNNYAGETYLVWGSALASVADDIIDLSTLQADGMGVRLDGANSGDQSGWSVSIAGDVDGDGKTDILIGAYAAGKTYLVWGSSLADDADGVVDLSTLQADGMGVRLDGIDDGDWSGWSVSGAGDVDGDGYADILIGAHGADPHGKSYAGETYLISGALLTAEKNDGDGVVDIASTLFPDNHAPTASNDKFTVDEDTELTGNVLVGNGFGSDSDQDGDALSVSIEHGPYHGSLVLNADGTFNYTPDTHFNGEDTFTYLAYDGRGREDTATVTITVDPVNDAPVVAATVSEQAAPEGAPFSFDVPANTFEDIDGDTLTLTAALENGDPLADWLNFDGATFTGTPGQEDVGEITIRVTANDGKGGTVFTDFDITVEAAPAQTVSAIVLNGIQTADHAGYSVSDAGDVDGDGLADILIGADYADPNGVSLAGQTYLVWGSALAEMEQGEIDLEHIAENGQGVRLDGIDDTDFSGHSVSSAGDVDGDGKADILIGAYRSDPNGNSASGESYLVWGSVLAADTDGVIDLEDVPSQGFGVQLNGVNPFSHSGWSVSGAGDVDGDGLEDVLIGAHESSTDGAAATGETYLVWGSALQTDADGIINLDTLDADGSGLRLKGINNGDRSGYSVSSVGDVDGDGLADLVIGAPGADPNGKNGTGQSYLVWGASLAADADGVVELEDLVADGAGVVLNGMKAGDGSGGSVAGAGDVDGDGKADLLVGAQYSGPVGGPDSGQAFLVWGAALSSDTDGVIDLSGLDTSGAGVRLKGINADDAAAYSVSSAGDVDGDGLADILIGAPAADPNGIYGAGETYLVWGAALVGDADGVIDLASLGANGHGLRISGADANDLSGWSVSAAGDVDGDGLADILIGAKDAGANGHGSAGQTYLLSGALLTAEKDGGDGVIDLAELFPNASATAPVILDLDGDGVSFVSGVNFDYDADGALEAGAWAAPGDAFLVLDRNGDGQVNDASEISFIDDLPGAQTDLEGLRAFDSDGDGFLTAADEAYGDFFVWDDADSDGISDAGEMAGLAEAGVVSISLTSDGVMSSEMDGALIHGVADVELADGTMIAAADASLSFDELPDQPALSNTMYGAPERWEDVAQEILLPELHKQLPESGDLPGDLAHHGPVPEPVDPELSPLIGGDGFHFG